MASVDFTRSQPTVSLSQHVGILNINSTCKVSTKAFPSIAALRLLHEALSSKLESSPLAVRQPWLPLPPPTRRSPSPLPWPRPRPAVGGNLKRHRHQTEAPGRRGSGRERSLGPLGRASTLRSPVQLHQELRRTSSAAKGANSVLPTVAQLLSPPQNKRALRTRMAPPLSSASCLAHQLLAPQYQQNIMCETTPQSSQLTRFARNVMPV